MTEEASRSCANCGKAEESEATLKICNGCKLVKYCGRDCQLAHRPHHKNACKKRAAELHEEALFRQPRRQGDCPICFLPLPELSSGRGFMSCCGKIICKGCSHAHELLSCGRPACPFCRANLPSTVLEVIKMVEKRVDVNDARGIYQLGHIYFNGDEDSNINKDVRKAMELFHRAAELGSAEACRNLGILYEDGYDGVIKDEMKAKKYFEKGAIAGSSSSRYMLGCDDGIAGRYDRAIKHWLIAASCGDIRAVNSLKDEMTFGNGTRDHYDQALQSYEKYVNAVRSDQRDRAAAYSNDNKYLTDA